VKVLVEGSTALSRAPGDASIKVLYRRGSAGRVTADAQNGAMYCPSPQGAPEYYTAPAVDLGNLRFVSYSLITPWFSGEDGLRPSQVLLDTWLTSSAWAVAESPQTGRAPNSLTEAGVP
jgi:hypothetical protein